MHQNTTIVRWAKMGLIAVSALLLSACVGMAIDATTDAALAVAKVPFKVGGAVVDVVTD